MSTMAPKIDPDKYMTIGNAAKLAGVTRTWLRLMVKNGTVAGIQMDGQYFALRSSVEAYSKTIPPTGRPRSGRGD